MNDIALNHSREGHIAHPPAPLTPHYQHSAAEQPSDGFGIVDLIRTFERHKILVLTIVTVVTLATLVLWPFGCVSSWT